MMCRYPRPGGWFATLVAVVALPATLVASVSLPATLVASVALPATLVASVSLPATLVASVSLPATLVASVSLPATLVASVSLSATGRAQVPDTAGAIDVRFPPELVDFVPSPANPLFSGTGQETWDRLIRERGYILREGNTYYLWYTGYRGEGSDTKSLGLATSPDGIDWTRDPANPIFDKSWVEDMCVVKHEGVYYMFAEGKDDIAHLLTSTDRRHWQDLGSLDVRLTNGQPIPPGPYGTPTIWIESGTWFLFYERRDAGIWLATSRDRQVWTNVQDDPVIATGPDRYDQHAVALNQVIKHQGRYYGYYHCTAEEPWKNWSTAVAVSDDLIHWKKFPGNPIVAGNKSSGIVVHDGEQFRLYTMHPDVRLYVNRARTVGEKPPTR